MCRQVFTDEDAGHGDDYASGLSAENADYPLVAALAGMDFPDRRTALLVHGALVRSGTGVAAIKLVHQYLVDADAISLLTVLRTRYRFTFVHCLKTLELSMFVARQTGVEDNERAVLAVGALLHDIGKLSVPISLLMLQRSLRPVEIDRIRTHAEAGYELLSDKRIFGWNSVLEIIRHHHEYLNGTGYPFGLVGGQISWRTRCVTVCDVLSALTERRPYRPAMSRDEAFSILIEMTRAGKLDGEIVGIFRS